MAATFPFNGSIGGQRPSQQHHPNVHPPTQHHGGKEPFLSMADNNNGHANSSTTPTSVVAGVVSPDEMIENLRRELAAKEEALFDLNATLVTVQAETKHELYQVNAQAVSQTKDLEQQVRRLQTEANLAQAKITQMQKKLQQQQEAQKRLIHQQQQEQQQQQHSFFPSPTRPQSVQQQLHVSSTSAVGAAFKGSSYPAPPSSSFLQKGPITRNIPWYEKIGMIPNLSQQLIQMFGSLTTATTTTSSTTTAQQHHARLIRLISASSPFSMIHDDDYNGVHSLSSNFPEEHVRVVILLLHNFLATPFGIISTTPTTTTDMLSPADMMDVTLQWLHQALLWSPMACEWVIMTRLSSFLEHNRNCNDRDDEKPPFRRRAKSTLVFSLGNQNNNSSNQQSKHFLSNQAQSEWHQHDKYMLLPRTWLNQTKRPLEFYHGKPFQTTAASSSGKSSQAPQQPMDTQETTTAADAAAVAANPQQQQRQHHAFLMQQACQKLGQMALLQPPQEDSLTDHTLPNEDGDATTRMTTLERLQCSTRALQILTTLLSQIAIPTTIRDTSSPTRLPSGWTLAEPWIESLGLVKCQSSSNNLQDKNRLQLHYNLLLVLFKRAVEVHIQSIPGKGGSRRTYRTGELDDDDFYDDNDSDMGDGTNKPVTTGDDGEPVHQAARDRQQQQKQLVEMLLPSDFLLVGEDGDDNNNYIDKSVIKITHESLQTQKLMVLLDWMAAVLRLLGKHIWRLTVSQRYSFWMTQSRRARYLVGILLDWLQLACCNRNDTKRRIIQRHPATLECVHFLTSLLQEPTCGGHSLLYTQMAAVVGPASKLLPQSSVSASNSRRLPAFSAIGVLSQLFMDVVQQQLNDDEQITCHRDKFAWNPLRDALIRFFDALVRLVGTKRDERDRLGGGGGSGSEGGGIQPLDSTHSNNDANNFEHVNFLRQTQERQEFYVAAVSMLLAYPHDIHDASSEPLVSPTMKALLREQLEELDLDQEEEQRKEKEQKHKQQARLSRMHRNKQIHPATTPTSETAISGRRDGNVMNL